MGQFRIVREPPQPDVLYFRGILELISRRRFHQALGEKCNEKDHIEGWLVSA